MMDSVSDAVETFINKNEIWLHFSEIFEIKNFPKDHYATSANKGLKILETALKTLLSPAGELLLAHGLDTDQNWKKTDDTVLYRHPLDWSDEMNRCIEKYNKRFNELSKLVEEYEALSEQTSGNDALDLWDSI
ncbi:MAG: hypothetical protein ABIJ31_01125 [Pseudomonadota bacterium]